MKPTIKALKASIKSKPLDYLTKLCLINSAQIIDFIIGGFGISPHKIHYFKEIRKKVTRSSRNKRKKFHN